MRPLLGPKVEAPGDRFGSLAAGSHFRLDDCLLAEHHAIRFSGGFLSAVFLPAADHHIAVLRIEFHEPGQPSGLLGRDQGGA